MPVKTIKIDEYHSGCKQMYQCINTKTIKIDEFHSGRKQTYQCINTKTSI